MFDNKPEIRIILIEDLTAWNQRSPSPTNSGEAKRFCKELVEYSLRMLWLGRYDKMSEAKRNAYSEVSLAFLPDFCNYTGPKPGEVAMSDLNHYELADQVFEKFWNEYLADDDLSLIKPPSQKKSSFWSFFFK